jgi:tetratricopeptide (TPR) repeat protein
MGQIKALRALFAALVGSAVSACASGPFFLPPDDSPQTAYGAVLSASYANRVRDMDASARLYGAALEFEPQSALVSERAFLSALTAGDFERADRAAAGAVQAPDASQLVHRYVDAARLAGARLPASAAEEARADRFNALVAGVLADWSAVKRGGEGREAAFARAQTGGGLQSAAYLLVHRALLLETAGRFDDAEALYRAAEASLDLRNFSVIMLGGFLERRGLADDAAALYQRQIARENGEPDPEVVAALDRVQAGVRAPRLPRPDEAAARALYAPAAFLTARASPEYDVLYLRLIERLDPGFARGRMSLALVLQQTGFGDEALASFDQLADSAFRYDAGVRAAWLRFRTGQQSAAMESLQRLPDAPPFRATLGLADMHRLTGDCAEALALYQTVIAALDSQGEGADWPQLFYAGVCTEATQGFAAAEPLFERALARGPEEPLVLNHLGYSWIIGGVRVDEGVALTERAVALAPENGSILDSYGWGLFKLGRLDEAVRWLERAAAQSPGNPTIQWHLGDAYAAVGRVLEAEFQWRRALELDPEPAEITLLDRRLELGLQAGPVDLP